MRLLGAGGRRFESATDKAEISFGFLLKKRCLRSHIFENQENISTTNWALLKPILQPD
jgi:hypothetical protein